MHGCRDGLALRRPSTEGRADSDLPVRRARRCSPGPALPHPAVRGGDRRSRAPGDLGFRSLRRHARGGGDRRRRRPDRAPARGRRPCGSRSACWRPDAGSRWANSSCWPRLHLRAPVRGLRRLLRAVARPAAHRSAGRPRLRRRGGADRHPPSGSAGHAAHGGCAGRARRRPVPRRCWRPNSRPSPRSPSRTQAWSPCSTRRVDAAEGRASGAD
jgi:hypothetical protein